MQNLQLKDRRTVSLVNIKDMKSELIRIVRRIVENKYRTQKEAAVALGIDQPKISQIVRSRIEGFSLSYLLNLLVVLNQDIRIEIKDRS